jgi:hypothetical protein
MASQQVLWTDNIRKVGFGARLPGREKYDKKHKRKGPYHRAVRIAHDNTAIVEVFLDRRKEKQRRRTYSKYRYKVTIKYYTLYIRMLYKGKWHTAKKTGLKTESFWSQYNVGMIARRIGNKLVGELMLKARKQRRNARRRELKVEKDKKLWEDIARFEDVLK